MNAQTAAAFDDDRTLFFRPVLAQAATTAAVDVAPVDVREIGAFGAINPVIAAANPLLMMVPTLRTAAAPSDVPTLRHRLIEMLKDFDTQCVQQGLPDDQRHIARYALCTVIDEAIQMTPWGGTANWAQQSLLIHFFRESWGGEKFFQILDKMAETPSRFVSLLELFYVCLSLGFMGRFQLQDAAGRQAVADLRERLYVLARQGRAQPERVLSGKWAGVQVEARRFQGFGLVGLITAGIALAALALYAVYWFRLADTVSGLELQALSLPKVEVTAAAKAPAPKPRLAQLLASDIQAGQVQVKDLALESTVTVLGETLFESGAAQPSTRAEPLLQRVAQALDQLEGQVVVAGHTDNTPTRTLRFASNFELSKERAENVRRLLAASMKAPERLSAEGRGDTDPVAPNTSAEGKAQNRRVEITLRVPSATN